MRNKDKIIGAVMIIVGLVFILIGSYSWYITSSRKIVNTNNTPNSVYQEVETNNTEKYGRDSDNFDVEIYEENQTTNSDENSTTRYIY